MKINPLTKQYDNHLDNRQKRRLIRMARNGKMWQSLCIQERENLLKRYGSVGGSMNKYVSWVKKQK